MGCTIALIVVRGKEKAKIHSEFQIDPTGELREDPDFGLFGAELPDGWYMIYVGDCQWPTTDVLKELSLNAELLYSEFEEHCNWSMATVWKDGCQIWSVCHNGGGKGDADLEITGCFPPEFGSIVSELQTKRRELHDCDYLFSVAEEITQKMTGFNYMDCYDGKERPTDRFEVLNRINDSRGREFWKDAVHFTSGR